MDMEGPTCRPMYADETFGSSIEAMTDFYVDPWTVCSSKRMERAGTILQANYYAPKATIAPEVDLDSWQKLAPHQWSSDDVINLIYDLAENCDEISVTELRGERFQNLLGSDLCRMTEAEFTDREPNYGRTLFRSVRQLIQTREPQSGNERISSEKEDFTRLFERRQGEQRRPVQEIIEDDIGMETCDETLLDPGLLSILGLKEYDVQCLTEIDALHNMKDGLKFSSEALYNERLTRDLPSHNSVYSNSFPCNPSYCGVSFEPCSELRNSTDCYSNDLTSASFTSVNAGTWSQTPTMHRASYPFISLHPTKTGSNRPMMMTMGQEWTPSFTDISSAMSATATRKVHLRRRTHCNRGIHLWEFICRLLKTSETLHVQDRIIQWEDQSDGVFRIVNSKEVAKLWGKCKRTEFMNYEKLSRALRWCRTYGFLSELPKNANLPKKLCFRFGPRAVNWQNCI